MMVHSAITDLAVTLTYISAGLHYMFFVHDRKPIPIDPQTARDEHERI